jgi:hypothetical protein
LAATDREKAKAVRYRAEAAKALELAERAESAEARRQLQGIAQVYRRLADKHDPPSK